MESSNTEDGNIADSKSIKAIDKKTVHQICSGQVVLDLATAVKELVENSIDAGATNIEIRLKEYGKESLEVSDNGIGIKESDFEALALKHYTSKLRQFTDLQLVNTFGFRGEALSSLSALGDLTITTHHEDSEVGFKLIFDHNGKLVDRNRTAREQGTSVCISNLFYTLPVRHKEFHRNFKKDFGRLMNVLYAFCLVNGSVRINCVNQVSKKKNVLLSTNGKNATLDTISSIFGVNQVKNVIKIEQKEPTETILEEFNLSQNVCSEYASMFLIEGYVSSTTHGCGRSAADRQFFFINNRPCDFPKLGRVINDIYHAFNRQQYPFVFVNISLNKDYVDVNVTPDKRQIMIHQENVLLVIVKSSLKHMFEHNSTFYAESKDSSQIINGSPCSNFLTSSPTCKSFNESTEEEKLNLSSMSSSTKQSSRLGSGNIASPLDRFRSKYEKSSIGNNNLNVVKQKTPEQLTLQSFFTIESKKRKVDNDCYFDDIESKAKKTALKSIDNEIQDDLSDLSCVLLNESIHSFTDDIHCNYDNNDVVKSIANNNVDLDEENKFNNRELAITTYTKGNMHQETYTSDIMEEPEKKVSEHEDNDMIIVDEVAMNRDFRETVIVQFDLKKIQDNYAEYILKKTSDDDEKIEVSSFRAKISVSDNLSAEQELGKNVTKEMFNKMEILGQFNLGFIVTKLDNDLFIIDQHASDEKYNYETLQQKHCLKGQKLIQPLPMNLTSVNESILLDNLEIFQKNGFEFEIKESNDEKQNDNKINLLTVPTSRNWTFSVDDVEELIFLLSDSPGVMCRPSRVHTMFASRACRTSVMVGTALNYQKMKRLVSHMAEINHPWNCPHGRPTMRHMINLQRIECT